MDAYPLSGSPFGSDLLGIQSGGSAEKERGVRNLSPGPVILGKSLSLSEPLSLLHPRRLIHPSVCPSTHPTDKPGPLLPPMRGPASIARKGCGGGGWRIPLCPWEMPTPA
jgi:hypothetical protein